MIIHNNNNLVSSKSNYYDDTYLVVQNGVGLSGRYYGGYRYEFYLLPGQRFEDRIKIDWPPPYKDNDSGIYVLGTVSVDGMLCLQQKLQNIVLWNPIAREFKIIPDSPFECVPPHRHPCRDLHGFGYDHVTNDYKVIQFVDSYLISEFGLVQEDRSSYETFWEIYSLRSNSWKKLDVNIPNCYYFTLKRRIGVYTNGICHWWARTNFNPNVDVEECLVSFNFSTELLFTTPMPSYLDLSRSFKMVDRELVLLNESIALIATYKEIATIHISILGELGIRESWIKLFTITCLPFIEYPIGVGNLTNIVFFKKNDNKIAWIDLNTKMIEELDFKVEKYVFAGKYKKSSLPMGELTKY
jgi:F-box interacting protein